MYSIIQTQTDLSTIITLDEAKRQCRLLPSFTLDDDDLNHLIAACTELAQVYTHRLLTPGTVVAESDEYHPVIQLPWGNVSAITEVLLDGVAYTDYTFSAVTQKLKVGKTYSNIKITYEAGYKKLYSTYFTDNVKITYEPGYNELPARVKQAILVMISTWYNNREDYVTGMTLETIPLTSLKALDSVRYWNA